MLRVSAVLALLRPAPTTIYARLRSRPVGNWRPVGRLSLTTTSYSVTLNERARTFEAACDAAARSAVTRPDAGSAA